MPITVADHTNFILLLLVFVELIVVTGNRGNKQSIQAVAAKFRFLNDLCHSKHRCVYHVLSVQKEVFL